MNKEEYFQQLLKWLLWGNGFVRKDLVEYFDITPVHASRIIKQFVAEYGEHLIREARGCYRASLTLQDTLKDHRPFSGRHFLDHMLVEAVDTSDPGRHFGLSGCVNVAKPLEGHADTAIIRQINAALQNNQSLHIQYIGMNLGDTLTDRWVYPLGYFFVYDRWHLHAYCFNRQGTRDFVLGRIQDVHTSCNKQCPVEQRRIFTSVLSLVPHSSLSDDQKRAVEREYAMTNGSLTIRVPDTLLYYAKTRYLGVQIAADDQQPPLVLLELKEEKQIQW